MISHLEKTVLEGLGSESYALIEQLFPICRSITGDGVRKTLQIMQQTIPLEIVEVPTGTAVFDWQVPKEWNIRDAYIKDAAGNKVVDFQKNNLHVVSYSQPVRASMSLAKLKAHLHTIPEQPDWIPYRTSYYNETWGFCLSHKQMQGLQDGEYEVVIDSSLQDGSLTYGEYFKPGDTRDEILFFAHCCHPSLCNDNLSGLAMLTILARELSQVKTRYSYRFIFTPATIGSITWLSQNEHKLANIRHGLVAAVAGDPGKMTYKKTRDGSREIDSAVLHVLKNYRSEHDVLEFSPYGYDERQFCSPGINLNMGRLTRTPNGCYPEYHTSADNLDLVKAGALADTLDAYWRVIGVLEHNRRYINTSPNCEPQLGRRGLYRKTGGHKDIGEVEFAYLWVLNLSDGEHSVLDIAERAGLKFDIVQRAVQNLMECDLLRPVEAD